MATQRNINILLADNVYEPSELIAAGRVELEAGLNKFFEATNFEQAKEYIDSGEVNAVLLGIIGNQALSLNESKRLMEYAQEKKIPVIATTRVIAQDLGASNVIRQGMQSSSEDQWKHIYNIATAPREHINTQEGGLNHGI